MKRTPEKEAVGKRYWEHYEWTGEFLMTDPMPEKCVAGLMDVIDETEELCYIDDGTPMEISKKNPSASVPVEARINPMPDEGKGSGLKASDPIDLGSSEVEKPMENKSRYPSPTFDEAEKHVEKATGGDTILDSKSDDALLLENASSFLCVTFSLTFFTDHVDKKLTIVHVCSFFQWLQLLSPLVARKRTHSISRMPRLHLDWALILRCWNLVCTN
jgi:hypothetical protein